MTGQGQIYGRCYYEAAPLADTDIVVYAWLGMDGIS